MCALNISDKIWKVQRLSPQILKKWGKKINRHSLRRRNENMKGLGTGAKKSQVH